MSSRLPGLDGLRALAAMAVFADHVEQTWHWLGLGGFYGNQLMSLGRQGVEVFFVLSGFLITHLLLRERDAAGSVSLRRFYARRTLRIWPLYYSVVLLAFVVIPLAAGLAPPRMHVLMTAQTRSLGAPGDPRLALFLLFLANVSFWWFPHVLCGSHLWSLGVEEQFYLVWPVIFRFVRRPFAVFALIVGTKVGFHMVLEYQPAWLAWLVPRDSTFRVLEFCKMCHYEAMAVGAGAAYVAIRWREAVQRVADRTGARLLAWAALLGGAALAGWNQGYHGIDPLTEIPEFGYAAFIVVMAHGSRRSVVLDQPVMVWLGARSYAFYMLHTSAMVLAAALFEAAGELRMGDGRHAAFVVFAFILAVAGAAASYRWLESPLLRLKDRRYGGAGA